MGREEQYDVENKSNEQRKGCYVSSLAASFIVVVFAVIVIAVGFIVYLTGTQGNFQCNCEFPGNTANGNKAGQVASTKSPPGDDCRNPNNACGSDVLVSVHWLNRKLFRGEKLGKSCIQVLDISWVPGSTDSGRELYEQGHIPGAQFYNFSECNGGGIGELPERTCFVSQMRRLGVTRDTHVVLYDSVAAPNQSKMVYEFQLYGHLRVSILDGSIEKWTTDGYINTTDIPANIMPGDFTLNYNPDLIMDYAGVVKAVGSNDTEVVDARGRDEFSGKTQFGELKKGHMPGAKNVEYKMLFNPDMTYKTPQELERMFIDGNVDLDKEMVVTCRSGVAATGLAVAAYIIGKTAPVYDMSWEEWSRLAPDSLIVID
ncbi:hypothetical protein ScPMuIL_014105 [Solemya velum]